MRGVAGVEPVNHFLEPKKKEMSIVRDSEIEPYLSLAAAVVIKAARDLHSIDNIQALDALLFWLGDCNYWLEALNLLIEPESVFIRVLRVGRSYAK